MLAIICAWHRQLKLASESLKLYCINSSCEDRPSKFGVFLCFGHSLLDLALSQQAEQVSTAHGGKASRAVDGDTSTDWESDTCMHTDWANNAWWRVDLGAPVPVAEVVIVNRNCEPKEGCAAFMDSFQIKIGKANI